MLLVVDVVVGIGRLLDLHAEAGGGLGCALQDAEVGFVQEELGVVVRLDAAHAEDVVEVGVGVGDQLDRDAHLGGHVQDVVGLLAGVDADRLAGAAIADHPAVLLEGADDQPAHLELVDERLARLVLLVIVSDISIGHVSWTRRRAAGG